MRTRATPDETATPPEAASVEQRVCALAALGLDEEEIRARLELPVALDAASERELAAAYRRGRALGRARMKEAQFEAALQGRVTAQAQVLRRLGEPREEDGSELEGAEPSAQEPLGTDTPIQDRD